MKLPPKPQAPGSEESGSGGTLLLATRRDERNNVSDQLLRDPWGSGLLDRLPDLFGAGARMDLAETDDEITIKVELPGVDPMDVRIGVMGNSLEIRGEQRKGKEERKKGYPHVAQRFDSLRRTVQLPVSVIPDEVAAAYKDGVLTIKVSKREDAKPRPNAVRRI